MGWITEDQLVGLTGASVAPKLYLALGIDGDTSQFMATQEAGMIVAVQPDPAAPFVPVGRLQHHRRSGGVREGVAGGFGQVALGRGTPHCMQRRRGLKVGTEMAEIAPFLCGLTSRNTDCTLRLISETHARYVVRRSANRFGWFNSQATGFAGGL